MQPWEGTGQVPLLPRRILYEKCGGKNELKHNLTAHLPISIVIGL